MQSPTWTLKGLPNAGVSPKEPKPAILRSWWRSRSPRTCPLLAVPVAVSGPRTRKLATVPLCIWNDLKDVGSQAT